MATTSFLYHSMQVKGYRYLRCEFAGGVIRHHIRAASSSAAMPRLWIEIAPFGAGRSV